MIDAINTEALMQQMREIQGTADGMNVETAAPPESGAEFGDMLTRLIEDVDSAQKQADVSIQNLASGDADSLQDVVMKMEQAEVSFQLMKEIRNKLLEAYKEVMSMQT
ncbi:MAG: flagellar hook-basal body complex protein FliE [Victivallales bacterium]|nr:flagellar hook-basal body complex protein FliE [Victivallales bacterium]